MFRLSRKSSQDGGEKDNTTAEKICAGTTPEGDAWEEEFPPLPPKRMKQNNLQPPKQQPWRQTANDQGTMDYDMITLNNEFNTLNSLIIIAELFRAVRELNNSYI